MNFSGFFHTILQIFFQVIGKGRHVCRNRNNDLYIFRRNIIDVVQ